MEFFDIGSTDSTFAAKVLHDLLLLVSDLFFLR